MHTPCQDEDIWGIPAIITEIVVDFGSQYKHRYANQVLKNKMRLYWPRLASDLSIILNGSK